jgi:tRNA pseudouridine(55) synthase
MAEGLLLVLLGDECKKQGAYTKLDKQYEVEIVLELGTDTGDVLGLPKYTEAPGVPTRASILQALRAEVGARSRRYPAYSSKTVNGKPLFVYALEGTLDTITMPEHIERFYQLELIRSESVPTEELLTRIKTLLAIVPRSDEPSKALGADFRQDRVRAEWQALGARLPARMFTVLTIRVTCGSGAYMRTLAERIGEALGSTGVALTIKRTTIGKYQPVGSWGVWLRQYR